MIQTLSASCLMSTFGNNAGTALSRCVVLAAGDLSASQ